MVVKWIWRLLSNLDDPGSSLGHSVNTFFFKFFTFFQSMSASLRVHIFLKKQTNVLATNLKENEVEKNKQALWKREGLSRDLNPQPPGPNAGTIHAMPQGPVMIAHQHLQHLWTFTYIAKILANHKPSQNAVSCIQVSFSGAENGNLNFSLL